LDTPEFKHLEFISDVPGIENEQIDVRLRT